MSELTATADKRPLIFQSASQTFAAGNSNAAAAIDGNPLTGWSINGGQGRDQNAVFLLAKPLTVEKEVQVRLVFERYYAAGLGRFRFSVTTDPRSLQARSTPANIEELLCIPAHRLTPNERDRLREYYLSVAPELTAVRAEIQKLHARMPAFPTTLVMAERPSENPRPTHVHRRGEFLQPTEVVNPEVLSILPGMPSDASRNRLSFARWLVDPANPLVGRVTMNRQWAAFFGRGIVRTTEDFGVQGQAPSHPELLDWLAVEFVNRGWSMKKMHRLIVTSATYQQSSQLSPELRDSDPENRLLARGPRFRLEAELIRDAALATSGLLTRKLGGASVFPPQPASVTTEGAYGGLAWRASSGPDRYRRGLYTYSKRTAPFAMFSTFDAPSGEACVARREASNTPLQALTVLNDTVFMEIAQEHGRHLVNNPKPVSEGITELFRRCLTRPPAPDERDALIRFFHAQRQRFAKNELNAATIAGTATSAGRDAQAAWTVVARAIMNLDEFCVRD